MLNESAGTIETQVELLSPDEKRVVNVAGYHVGFVHVEALEGGVEVGARHDLLELVDLLEQEDAVALRFVVGLDDPCRVGILLELVEEDSVLICMQVALLGKVKVRGKKSICAPPQTSSLARKCSFFSSYFL